MNTTDQRVKVWLHFLLLIVVDLDNNYCVGIVL